MIQLSQPAANEIQRLKAKRQEPDLPLRLRVQPSNCASMSYVMQLDPSVNPEDHHYDCQGIHIVVDRSSLLYLDGLTIDYSEDLMGGSFRFHNPNATETCGCGNSFSTRYR